MRTTRFQSSFEFGEISPRLWARVDLPAYNKATRRMENAYALVHGGATKRRGTEYLGAVKDETSAVRLIPFVYNNNTRFMLVLNNGVIQIINVATNSFIESNGARFELPVPYTASELKDLKYAQAGAVMWLVHPAHFPRQLQRITDTNWSLTQPEFGYLAVTGVSFSNAYISFRIVGGSDEFQEGEYFVIKTDANGAILPPVDENDAVINGYPQYGYGAYNEFNAVPANTTRKDVTITTSGQALSYPFRGQPVLNGRQLNRGDRVLVKDQDDKTQNGVWVVGDPEGGDSSTSGGVQATLGSTTLPAVPDALSHWAPYINVYVSDNEGNQTTYQLTEGVHYTRDGSTFYVQQYYEGTGVQLWGQTGYFTYVRNVVGVVWTRAVDFVDWTQFVGAVVKVVGFSDTGTYYKQTGTALANQTWERFDGYGNGRIVAVNSMPGSTGARTWTITCTLSTPARQEWSVVANDIGSPPAYWKTGDYPSCIAYFEQRLFFGGSPQWPQHIWGSAAGDVLNLTVGNLDSDGVIMQIAGNDYNSIIHLVSARQLIVMTSSTEFSVAGPNNNAISGIAANIIKDHTRNGCNYVRPLRIGREVVFAQKDGRKVRAISYSLTEDANVAPDVSIFAEHLTAHTPIIDMAFASDPDYVAWVVRNDGTLLSMTLSREFETTAWAKHSTDGTFENVATVPGLISDEVYVIVKREVDGIDRKYIERFDYTEYNNILADSAKYRYAAIRSAILSGLEHLEGKEVSVYADGKVHPNRVVTDGQITLEYPANTVWAGLPYTMTLELLNPEFGDAIRTSQGSTISITDLTLRVQDTATLQLNGVEIAFRTNLDGLDVGIAPFTGDKKIKKLGWAKAQNQEVISITSDKPTPCTVLGVIIDAAVNA